MSSRYDYCRGGAVIHCDLKKISLTKGVVSPSLTGLLRCYTTFSYIKASSAEFPTWISDYRRRSKNLTRVVVYLPTEELRSSFSERLAESAKSFPDITSTSVPASTWKVTAILKRSAQGCCQQKMQESCTVAVGMSALAVPNPEKRLVVSSRLGPPLSLTPFDLAAPARVLLNSSLALPDLSLTFSQHAQSSFPGHSKNKSSEARPISWSGRCRNTLEDSIHSLHYNHNSLGERPVLFHLPVMNI